MRNLLLLLSLLFGNACMAQNTCNVTIGTTASSYLKIRFGGQQYSLQDQRVTFQGLKPGSYDLTIYQVQNRGNGPEYVEVFKNSITLTAQKHLEIMVMRFGKVAWDEGYIPKDDWNKFYPNPKPADASSSDQAVTNEQFNNVKRAMQDASAFNRMETARAVFKNNLFRTDQIKALMGYFSDFDILDFLKFAWDYTVDKGNYYTLGDGLSAFNRPLLMDFIKSK